MNPPINLEELCFQTQKVVKEAADFIKGHSNKVGKEKIEFKSLNSLVSFVDKGAEEILVAGLSKLLPDSSFLVEEGTVERSSSDYEWLVDPLDGTTNFLHSIPPYAVSVGLNYKGSPIMGVVHEVNLNECFYAWKDGGAWLDGKSIKVSDTNDLKESLLATGFPYYDFSGLKPYLETLEYFMLNTRGLRRHGAAAIDLVYVACGRYEAYYEYSLQPYDISAGAFIVQEAGGIATDYEGGDNHVFSGQVIAGNPAIHQAVLEVVKGSFYS